MKLTTDSNGNVKINQCVYKGPWLDRCTNPTWGKLQTCLTHAGYLERSRAFIPRPQLTTPAKTLDTPLRTLTLPDDVQSFLLAEALSETNAAPKARLLVKRYMPTADVPAPPMHHAGPTYVLPLLEVNEPATAEHLTTEQTSSTPDHAHTPHLPTIVRVGTSPTLQAKCSTCGKTLSRTLSPESTRAPWKVSAP